MNSLLNSRWNSTGARSHPILSKKGKITSKVGVKRWSCLFDSLASSELAFVHIFTGERISVYLFFTFVIYYLEKNSPCVMVADLGAPFCEFFRQVISGLGLVLVPRSPIYIKFICSYYCIDINTL